MPSNAERVQGAGPTGTEGDPFGVVVLSGGGGAVTIADGADVCEGATTDAANTTGAAGTISGKLRGILTILANVWDGVNGRLNTRTEGYFAGLGPMSNPVASGLRGYFTGSVNVPMGLEHLLNPGPFVQPALNGGLFPLIVNTFFDTLIPGLQSVRNINTFNTAQAAAAGNTALWTPAANRKFRLMRYKVEVTGNASFAVAGVLTISLFDGAAGAIGLAHDVYIPVAAAIVPGAVYSSPWIDLGNGILSGAVNTILNVNLSAALATGNVRVIACGTEE